MHKQTLDPVVQTVVKVNSNVDQNSGNGNQFVTVVAVGTDKNSYDNSRVENKDIKTEDHENGVAASEFVTVLTVGSDVEVSNATVPSEIVEEVLVYRLPGERLGFGLKFEGGTKTTECVRRLFIQSCSPNSPASRVKCSWDCLMAGDEILKIDSFSVKDMTRIDCVRCLKESNVVIKLLVRHYHQQVPNENVNASDTVSMIQSDEESPLDTYVDKIQELSLPPPVPPRKMSRKILEKIKNSNLIMPIQEVSASDASLKTKLVTRGQSNNNAEVNTSNISKDSRTNTFSHSGVNDKFIRATRNGNRSRKIPDIASSWIHIRDRDSSDVNNSPPNAEVYLDLLSQDLDCGIRTESESDDTGSTISTVIDKQNSIFIASNASSIASDSVPSTPRAIQKHINVNNVINPFELLEMEYGSENQSNNDFLFTRFVTSHDILYYEDGTNNNKKKSDFYKISLVPPANFQDAPLSYGNEDVNTIIPQDYLTDKTNLSITNTPGKESSVENSDDICQIDNCITPNKSVEKTNIPIPKPRTCSNIKSNLEEIKEILQNSHETLGTDEPDNIFCESNLPRLVNFVPKTITDIASPHTDNDDITHKTINSTANNTCIIKLNNQSGSPTVENYESSSMQSSYDPLNEMIDECKFVQNIQNDHKEDDKQNIKKEEYSNKHSPKEKDKQSALYFNKWNDKSDICKQTDYADDNKQSIFNQFTVNISMKENMEVKAPVSERDIIKNTASLLSNERNLSETSMDEKLITRTDEESTDSSETVDIQQDSIQSDQQHVATSESSSLSSVSSLPLHFSSRLPPDGQEFPTTCDESQIETYVRPKNQSSERERPKSYSFKTNDCKVTPSYSNSIPKTQSLNNDLDYVRNFVWHRDKHSSGSVKDKIAIFSSPENNEPVFPNNNLMKHTKICKSSENLVDSKGTLTKNSPVSKSCLYINKMSNNDDSNKKTNVNSAQCIVNSENDVTNKETINTLTKSSSQISKSPLLHSTSMTKIPNYKLPTRSQSMLDINHLGAQSGIGAPDIYNGDNQTLDSRKLALNNLIEQRRRRLSKLRGLVIPQKEVTTNEPVLDLPVIRSKEQIRTDFRKSLDCTATLDTGLIRNNSITGLPLSTWKDNSIPDTFPKYSPAFKRKSLQVFGMEQQLEKTLDSDLKSPNKSDVFKLLSNDNKITDKSDINTNCDSSCFLSPNDIKSLSQIPHNFECTCSNSSVHDCASKENINKETEPQNYQSTNDCSPSCSISSSEHKDDTDFEINPNKSRFMSFECSPLSAEANNSVENSIDMPANNYRNIYNTMKPEHEEHKPFGTLSNNNNLSNRILKPQSVEAINRKNILASAKCRSGRDFKAASPLIQRKFNENENVTEEKTSSEKYSTVAYITVTDETILEAYEDKDAMSNDILNQGVEEIEHKSSGTAIKCSEIFDLSNEKVTNPNDQVILRSEDMCTSIEMGQVNNHAPSIILDISLPKLKASEQVSPTTETNSNALTQIKQLLDEKNTRRTDNKSESNYKYPEKLKSVSHIKKQYESLEVHNGTSLNQASKQSPINNITEVSSTSSEISELVVSINSVSLNESPKTKRNDSIVSDNLEYDLGENLDHLINEVNEGADENNDTYVNMADVIIVELHRETAGGSTGIILTGGIDYEARNIVIHKILAGSCAHKDGRLQKGDRVLLINGKKMSGLTHKESIDILKDPRPKVTIFVQRCSTKETLCSTPIEANAMVATTPSEVTVQSPCFSDPMIVVLTKEGAGLGFSLDGGRDSPKGDKPLIIKKIFTGGAAEKCGNLQAGDELLKINETDVLKMTRIEVWSLMKKLPNGIVTLVIRRQ